MFGQIGSVVSFWRRLAAVSVALAAIGAGAAPGAVAQSGRTAGGHTGDYLALLGFTGYSKAEDPSANTGYPRLQDDSSMSAGGGLALGYNWDMKGVPIRSEVEFDYRTGMSYNARIASVADFKASVSSAVLLFNAYYDYALSDRWTLYGGGGIGFAHNMSDVDRVSLTGGGTTNIRDSGNGPAWDIAVGAIWQLGRSWDLDLRYRYLNLGEQSYGPHSDGTTMKTRVLYTQDLMLGLVYRF